MNGKWIIGQFLLWAGFLSGAFATVYQIKSEPDEWATINWPWFLGSIAVGVVGIAIFRSGRKASATQVEKAQADYATLKPAIERLSLSVAAIRNDLSELAPSEIPKRIDDQCAEDFNTFAEARESIIGEKGMADFANVMTQFAAAERAVNRAWSAGADGYLDEAESCLERAGVLLENTGNLL
jgi:hypothetical protein